MEKNQKDYRDARLNGYKGSFQQFTSKYLNDTGSMAAATNTVEEQKPQQTIVREMLVEPRNENLIIEEEDKIMGLKPVYFYAACAAAVVFVIAMGILIWMRMKKKNPAVVAAGTASAPAQADVVPSASSTEK